MKECAEMRAGTELLDAYVALPCPFCGKQPTIEPWHGGGPRKRLVECSNDYCLARPAVTGASRKGALANWNGRPGLPIYGRKRAPAK